MAGRHPLALMRRRLIGVVPVFALVVLGAFALLESAPGDAVDAYLAGIGGGDAAQMAALRCCSVWACWRTAGSVRRLRCTAPAALLALLLACVRTAFGA